MGFWRILLLALCFGPLTLGCRDGESAAPAGPAPAVEPEVLPANSEDALKPELLIHRKFTLSQVNGAAWGQEKPPFIAFGDNLMVSGRVCNSFRGPGQLSGGVLSMKNAAATKMACLDEDLAALETLILKMLENGAEVSVDAAGLSLKGGGDVLLFQPAAAGE